MAEYTFRADAFFQITADSEKEARQRMSDALLAQSEDIYYGNERMYVPWPPAGELLLVEDEEDEEDIIDVINAAQLAASQHINP